VSQASKLTMNSLILATGVSNTRAAEVFVHQKIETQRIDLGGRTIVATLIRHDPAHYEAILKDLRTAGDQENLDIAMLETEEAS
jgi:hypothetical protein